MSNQPEKYQIETKISSRADFQEIINTNPGVIIIKLGAEWCGPCKTIKAPVSQMMQYIVSDKIRCFIIDVDESIELYGLLKQKKMVNGIPAILAYYQENKSYIPDDIVIGADLNQIQLFFKRCIEHA
jgi:thiol-disulfide isomerase/thioredoxin